MGQLTLNIIEQSEVKVIASSAFNFRVEIVYQLGKSDMNNIFEISLIFYTQIQNFWPFLYLRY